MPAALRSPSARINSSIALYSVAILLYTIDLCVSYDFKLSSVLQATVMRCLSLPSKQTCHPLVTPWFPLFARYLLSPLRS